MIDEERLRQIEHDNEKLMSEGYGSRRLAEVIAALREAQGENGRLREALQLLPELDCGDNSCLFSTGGGMRTNGGCCCMDNVGRSTSKKLKALAALVGAARAALAAKEKP